MDILELAFRYVATPAIIVTAIAWLTREIVKRLFDMQAQRIRVDLEKASTLAIESVRQNANREIESARHSMHVDLERQKSRYSRLQDVRLAPLQDLYAKMAELFSAAERVQTELRYFPDEDVSEYLEKLVQLVRDAQSAHARALLFLPSSLAHSVEKQILLLRDAEMYYDVAVRHESIDAPSARVSLGQRLTQDFNSDARLLADRLRSLLGVEGSLDSAREGAS